MSYERKSLHLQPARVEEELQQSEDGDVEVEVVALVTLGGVKELTTNQTSKEKSVDGQRDDLRRETDFSVFSFVCVGDSEH